MSTRNVVEDWQAEENRSRPGGYTFNAFSPDDYDGRVVVFAVVRLGDHAHISVYTGQQTVHPVEWRRPSQPHMGYAGRLIFAWRDWLHFPA